MIERHHITFVVETDPRLEVDPGNLLNGALLALPDLLNCLVAECYLDELQGRRRWMIRIVEDETSVSGGLPRVAQFEGGRASRGTQP